VWWVILRRRSRAGIQPGSIDDEAAARGRELLDETEP